MSTDTHQGRGIGEMVTVSPLAWEPLPGPQREPWRWVLAALMVITALLVASMFVRLPYYIESPGAASPVAVAVRPPGPSHRIQGSILLSTVAVQTRVDPVQLVSAWLDPNQDVVRKQEVTGGVNTAQFLQENQVAMDQSQQDAVVVALRRLGYKVPEHGDGVIIAAVSPGTPADGHLHPGDVVTSADGTPTPLSQTLISVIQRHRPGSSVRLVVERPHAAPVTETLTLAPCPVSVCGPTGSSHPFVGVGLQTRNDNFTFPFRVDFALNGVGGPSAGLAFTLSVINAVTNGNLTGGHKVAVTGTIGLDGSVGPIGGIALKTVAVERAGADYFIVPKDDGIPGDELQYSAAAAKARGHHLKVIGVANLDEALAALRSIGGNVTGIPSTAPPLSAVS